MATNIPFVKMVGAGNDFLIVESAPRANGYWSSVAKAMCDRRYGIGADGVLVLEPSRAADARMRVINADGSEAEMCGNGARCVARFLGEKRRRATVTLDTLAGTVRASVRSGRVQLQMTEPRDVRGRGHPR